MSSKELKRHHVISQLCEGSLFVRQAAALLNLSERRIKQLKKEFSLLGPISLIHGNARKTSPRKLSEDMRKQILDIYQSQPFKGCNFSFFRELLESRYGIKVSYSTLWRILNLAGHKSPKMRRRKRKLHPSRERKPAAGMMLQADATPFPWFGGKQRFALHGFIDDATGTVTGLYLCENECLLGYLEVLRQTLTSYGIPQSLYPDRYSVFFVNPKNCTLSIEEQLAGTEKRITQFGKIMHKLGIDMFPAHSPQAKGRIERLWGTLQQRLPVEFALADIHTIEEANRFLIDYLPRFNAQFSVAPKESYSAYVPFPDDIDLDRLLSVRFERKLSSGSTISIQNKRFLVEQNRFPAKTPVTILLSEKFGLRAIIHGESFPVVPLDPFNKPEIVRTGILPKATLALIQRYLLKDAKIA